MSEPRPLRYPDDFIRAILTSVRTSAMVGASADQMRPSYFAMLYLLAKGYEIIPVNPRYAGQTIQGRLVHADIATLPMVPDMVQIFRKSDVAGAIVDAAIAKGIRTIWLQLGVRDDAAAARAEAAGCRVVMDRCPKIEYGRLFGELGWLGVDRGVISSKRGTARQLKRKPGGLR